jgi:pentatricopeptide repeat protein
LLDAVKRGEYEGVVPDVVTFNTILKGYAQSMNVDECFKVIAEMVEVKVDPDDVTYGILLDACIADNNLNKANEVLDGLIKSGMAMNTVLYTTFIKGFVRAEMLDRAMQLYETMKTGKPGEGADQEKKAKPDLITYSILIKAHTDKRQMERALYLLNDMQEAGYQPDDIVVNHLIEGCCHVSNIELGEKLYKEMVVSGKTKPSIYTIATMVKLYGKCGRSEAAIALVESMEEKYKLTPSVVIYTCLMSGCVRNKKYDRAVDVFRQVKSQGLKPDKMTYTTVVDASRQGSKWDQAYELCEEAALQRIELVVDTQNNLLGQMIAKSQITTARKMYKLMNRNGVHCTLPNVARRLKLTEESANE